MRDRIAVPVASNVLARMASSRFTRFFATVAFAMAPASASAHARWFLDPKIPLQKPVLQWDVMHTLMLVAAVMFVAGVALMSLLSSRVPKLQQFLTRPALNPSLFEWRILAILFGLTLVISSLEHVMIAPNLTAGTSIAAQGALLAQAILGAMLVVQSRIRSASILLIVMSVASFALFSIVEMIDYAFEILAIAGALIVIGPHLTASATNAKGRWWTGWSRSSEPSWQADDALAVFILRSGLGIQLVVLALHDKILEPEVSLAFVQTYPIVNFPRLLGLSEFSHLHFVFGAGLAEIAFGTLLILGMGTRIVGSALTVLFILTGLLFGVAELMGHIPIICIALILALRGDVPALQGIRPVRWQIASSGMIATCLVAIAVMPPAEAPAPLMMAAASPSAVLSDADPALIVPAALFSRFASETSHRSSKLTPELRSATQAIHHMLFHSRTMTAQPDKSATARLLFDLSTRYEVEARGDTAALWLRYGHLTGSCTPEELAAFRAVVSDPAWPQILGRAPLRLVAALFPVAQSAGNAIMGSDVDLTTTEAWLAIAKAAPDNGPNYVHTHALASIVRILTAAANEPGLN